MKMIGNSRENSLTILATIFFGQEWEWKSQTEKRNGYYRISKTEYFDREHTDYVRESGTQNGNAAIYGCNI